jgi:hypothetical protein
MKKYLSILAISVALFAPTLFAHAATISTGVQTQGGTITEFDACVVSGGGIWLEINGNSVTYITQDRFGGQGCGSNTGLDIPFNSGDDIEYHFNFGNSSWNDAIVGTYTPSNYTLTYTTDGHGTLTGSSTQIVEGGDSGSAVTAVPNSGYTFSQWSDSSTQNPRTDADVSGNISVEAQFTASINSGSGGGSVAPCAISSGSSIEASDTVCIFKNSAAMLKSNALALLNVAVPYLVGVAIALAIIGVVWVAVALVKGKI